MKIGPANASQQPAVDRPPQQNGQLSAEHAAAPAADNGAPLLNPVLTVESSGLVILQYRDDAGEVEVQIPSKQAVRAYEQNRDMPSGTGVPEVHAAAAVQAAAVQPPAPNAASVARQAPKVSKV